MQEIGPGFSLFHNSPSRARFTAGIQGTHRHKSKINPFKRCQVGDLNYEVHCFLGGTYYFDDTLP